MYRKLCMFVGSVVITSIAIDMVTIMLRGAKLVHRKLKETRKSKKIKGTKPYKAKPGQKIVYANYTVS